MRKELLLFLPFLFAAFACEKEEECFECRTVTVIETREFNDSIIVYKEKPELRRCKPTKAARDEEEKEMRSRAEEQREYIRAYADPDYDGFYTGARSIDTEQDLISLLDQEGPAYPFLIRVIECEHFSREQRD